jgi:adenosylcobinamide kinase / adenosylcobinamide-phosphate guanylyltransferase
VSNEVGFAPVATTPSGRWFQDALGRLNAMVASVADRVHLVVAGRVLDLSGTPVVP